MKKRFLSVLIAGVSGICILTGCQKAPEVSENSDVTHAKSSLEGEVEYIVAEESYENTAASGGRYDALVGTEENGIWICAEVPEASQTEYLAQREKELSEMDEEDKPGEWLNFGDDSLMMLSDGQKEASFARNTCASYVDETLKKNCDAIYKKAPEIDVIRNSEAASKTFLISRAKEILLEKLAVLDITEISISEIFYYELDGIKFYEFVFTPSFEKIGVASEFGQLKLGEVHPRGTAWITEDGMAMMSLEDYCGEIAEQSENGKVLTFPQVTDILEKYLKNNTLCGGSKTKLTRAELVYYPAFREPELILTPAWHIYIPLREMTEALESDDRAWKEAVAKGAAWNIYIDAVTGELIKVE